MALTAAPASTPAGSERSRLVLAGVMCFMGVLHFVAPGPFEKMVPKFLGSSRFWVLSSGVAELTGGILLGVPRTRRAGALLTAATMVAVFPGNVQMAVDAGAPTTPVAVAAWLRLPLQVPLVRWALSHARP